MALKTNTAEGGTPGAAVTVGNSGGASGSPLSVVTVGAGWTVTYSTDAPAHGAQSYKFESIEGATGSTAFITFNPAAVSAAAAARVMARFAAAPTSAQFMSMRGSGGVLTRWQFSASGALQLVNAAGGILYTAPAPVPTNTYVRLELFVQPGTGTTDGTITAGWYLGDSTTPQGSFTSNTVNAGTTQPATCQAGRIGTSSTAPTFYLDDLAVQDSATGLIGPVTNVAPIDDAGADKSAEPWSTVTLTGTDSDPDGTITTRAWTQTGGPAVTLAGASTATAAFTAPATIAGATLTFVYTVTDNAGATASDTVVVTVLPVTERAVIGGIEVPMRIRAS